MDTKILSKGKNMGDKKLTGGAVRNNMWAFKYATREECIRILWDVMTGDGFVAPSISWRTASGKAAHYSKKENPTGRLGNETYFFKKLGDPGIKKYTIRAGLIVQAKDKKKVRPVCFIWYPQTKDSYLFLSISGAKVLSDTENQFLRKLAARSIGWMRKEWKEEKS